MAASEKNLSFLLLAMMFICACDSKELTKENFDAEVHASGKHAFVKFFTPW
jgi:hypothetical protein